MALQIRRGTAAERTSVTPAAGELLYTTDTKLVYVGDGTTAGGVPISGGLADIVNDTSPSLGGNLDTNNFSIVSSGNNNITINPAGTGKTVVVGDLDVTGIRTSGPLNITANGLLSFGSNSTLEDCDIYIVRNSYSNAASAGFSFVQHHDTADAVNFNFYRSRGLYSAPTTVQDGDDIIDFNFTAKTSSTISGAAAISVVIDGVPSATNAPAKIVFSTNNGTSRSGRVQITAQGILETNQLGAFSGTDIGVTSTNTLSIGNFRLSQTGISTVDPAATVSVTGKDLFIAPTDFTYFGNDSTLADGDIYVTRNSYSSSTTAGFTFAQHHSTADAVNFSFYRTRGTGTAPTAVQVGDDLADITFLGHDGTQKVASATITSIVDGAVGSGIVGGRLRFLLHDGVTSGTAGLKLRADLRADGTLRVDKLSGISSTNITLPTTNSIDIGDVRLSSDGLSTFNSNANLYLTANSNGRVYIDGSGWPSSLGTAGQVLTTNGAGSLSWSNAPGYVARADATGSTGNIADAATANIAITGYKTYSLLKIQSTHAAWIRLYVSAAARTADAGRAEGVDPAPGAGVLAEIVTTGSQTILMSPGVFGWNNESPVTTDIACAITNKSGSTANISVTLTLVQLEA